MRIVILGDGGWGTATGMLLLNNGHDVTIWSHDQAYIDEMLRTRINRKFLNHVALPEGLKFSSDAKTVMADAELAVVAIPTKFLRPTLSRFPKAGALPLVSLVKGIENGTLLRPSEIIAEALGATRLAALSGPSHAEEVARRLPASVLIASKDEALAKLAQEAFHSSYFRVYTSTDIVGAELAGALKNVIAVACGICEGLGFGDNARSALVARGLAEMARLGAAMGGKAETFAGLAGVGDLFTTVVSPYGRNRAAGLALAQGKTLADIAAQDQVAEGVHACTAARDLAQKVGVEMPITEALCAILYNGKQPKAAVAELMGRTPKAE